MFGGVVMTAVACSFFEKVPAGDGLFHYRSVDASGYTRHLQAVVVEPPSVGDLVHLGSGTYRVIERAWSYIEYGSDAWPHGMTAPAIPPVLAVIVVPAVGPFVNEAPTEPEVPS